MLNTLKVKLFGGKPSKERRRLARVGKLPIIGAYIAKQQIAIKVTEPMHSSLWEWLVLIGWREVDIKTNRRKIRRLHDDTFSKLARAQPLDREAVYKEILGG
jgi:hypothetical protein